MAVGCSVFRYSRPRAAARRRAPRAVRRRPRAVPGAEDVVVEAWFRELGRSDRAAELDKWRRETIQAVEERKAARNAISQQVGQRKRGGEAADDLQQQSRALGEEIARLDQELAKVESQLSSILLELPNITLDQVPAGGEENNSVVRSWGTPREGARVQPHWEIGTRLGLIDFERRA